MTRNELLNALRMSDLEATDKYNAINGTCYPSPLSLNNLRELHQQLGASRRVA